MSVQKKSVSSLCQYLPFGSIKMWRRVSLKLWSLQKLSYNHTKVYAHGLVFPETLENCLCRNSLYSPAPGVWYKLVHQQHQLLPSPVFWSKHAFLLLLFFFYQASMCCQFSASQKLLMKRNVHQHSNNRHTGTHTHPLKIQNIHVCVNMVSDKHQPKKPNRVLQNLSTRTRQSACSPSLPPPRTPPPHPHLEVTVSISAHFYYRADHRPNFCLLGILGSRVSNF